MAPTAEETRRPVVQVDCDVHVVLSRPDEMLDYLSEPWRSRLGAKRPTQRVRGASYAGAPADGGRGYAPFHHLGRLDAWPSNGAPPGSDPEFVSQQLFVDIGNDFVSLLPTVSVYSVNPAQSTALCAAANRWMADTWLSKYNAEGRYFGPIYVCFDDPQAAAREIETWAGHPGMRQVFINNRSDRPLGHPQYDPVWEAAARHNLPVAMHFTAAMGGGQSGITPAGVFQTWVDYHAISEPLEYSAHFISWLCSGVFDRHPDQRMVLVEGGFLWHSPIIARLARHWARTSDELPARGKNPFEYLLRNVRFTSQPIEESPLPRDVASMFQIAGADRLLLYSSDYPHYDFDDPKRALPPQVDSALRRRVMSENARELYGLPATRPRDRFDVEGAAR